MEELRDDSGAFFCIHPFSDFGLWMEQGWGELRIAPLRIVAALVEDGYADDRRYAAAFAREKSSITGWGPVKIRMALSAKGISGEMADEVAQGENIQIGKLLCPGCPHPFQDGNRILQPRHGLTTFLVDS